MPDPRPPRTPPPEPWVLDEDDEIEPDWAQSIRDRRRDRGDRLRAVFATFDDAPADDDPASVIPARPQIADRGPGEDEEER